MDALAAIDTTLMEAQDARVIKETLLLARFKSFAMRSMEAEMLQVLHDAHQDRFVVGVSCGGCQ